MKTNKRINFMLIVMSTLIFVSCTDETNPESPDSNRTEIPMTLSHAKMLTSFRVDGNQSSQEGIELMGVNVFGHDLEKVDENMFRGVIRFSLNSNDSEIQEFLKKNGLLEKGARSSASSIASSEAHSCSHTYLGDNLDWWSSVSDLPDPYVHPGSCYKYYMQTCVTTTIENDPEFGPIMSSEFFVMYYSNSSPCELQ